MSDFTLKLNGNAVRSLLKSPQVEADLARRAHKVAAAAGPGKWNVHSEVGRNRARAVVVTGDFKARIREARTRALTRAIDAART